MARENNPREKDSAFIADLLEKLRRQMAETSNSDAPAEQEDVSVAPVTETGESPLVIERPVDVPAPTEMSETVVEAEESSVIADEVAGEEETFGEQQSTEELESVSETVVQEEASASATAEEHDVAVETSQFEEEATDSVEDVSAPADNAAVLNEETVSETEVFREEPAETQEVLLQPAVAEQLSFSLDDLTPPAPVEIETAVFHEPTPPPDAPKTDGGQYMMNLPEVSRGIETAELSDLPHAFERKRPAESSARTVQTPIETSAVNAEQLTIQIESHDREMPVPDDEQPASEGEGDIPFVSQGEATESSDISENIESGASENEQGSETVEDSPVHRAVPYDNEEPPTFHATPRAPRETIADVDFDAAPDPTVLREKVFRESEEEETSVELPLADLEKEIARKKLGARIRLIAVGALAAFLALFELISPLTDWLLHAFLLTRIPGVARLVDMQVLILICLIAYRPLVRGFEALRFRRVIPETLAFFAASITLLASIIFYLAGAPGQYLFALTGALVVLSAVLADYFRIGALARTFNAYAEQGTHFSGVLTDAKEHRLLHNLYATETVTLMETEPVTRIDGYVAASRDRVEGRYSSLISLSIAGGAALVDLIVLLILQKGAAFSFWSALVTFAAVLPLSLFAVHCFFAWMLTSRISEERIGVTGETAVYRYANVSVMTFDDTEAFPNGSVQVNGIKLCGDFRLDKALYLVSSLFDRVGGPLNSVFRISTADVRISDDVELRVLTKEGIEAKVNHEDVCAGTRAYLESVGVDIFRDIEDERAEQEGSRVLYVAYKGVLAVKFYVKYEISTAFEKNAEYYAKQGVSSVIMTADPLMDDMLLDKISYVSEYDVHIVKHDMESLTVEHEIPRAVELISYGPRKTLRRMPFFFKKYISLQRFASVASMVGVGVMTVLVPLLLAVVPLESVLMPTLCQLFALVPTVVMGLTLRRLNPNPQEETET